MWMHVNFQVVSKDEDPEVRQHLALLGCAAVRSTAYLAGAAAEAAAAHCTHFNFQVVSNDEDPAVKGLHSHSMLG
jgi:hypothetical protein